MEMQLFWLQVTSKGLGLFKLLKITLNITFNLLHVHLVMIVFNKEKKHKKVKTRHLYIRFFFEFVHLQKFKWHPKIHLQFHRSSGNFYGYFEQNHWHMHHFLNAAYRKYRVVSSVAWNNQMKLLSNKCFILRNCLIPTEFTLEKTCFHSWHFYLGH